MTNALPGFESPRPIGPARVGEPPPTHRPSRRWAVVPAILLVATAACSSAAAPSPSAPGSSGSPTGAPTATPQPSPTTAAQDGFEHPTGARDVVFRFEESGGFVPVEHNLTYAPSFTLYGDGTVIFRDPYAPATDANGGVRLAEPFKIASIGEDGIQAFLTEALGSGGLGIAQGPYGGGGADIPTSTFTINIGGETKQVSVTGMSPDLHPQNAAIVTQIVAFAEQLRTFGDDFDGEQPYTPAAYRGTLMSVDQPFGPVVAWPWPDLSPDDFDGGENEFFLKRTMTLAEVQALGIPGVEGGMTGVAVSHEGKLFTFSLRPLLPEESE